MAESLRYYIAHNGGLESDGEPLRFACNTVAEHFPGVTLEHLIGGMKKPEIVFAAVAFDGGYRSEDAGKSWTKIMDGDVRTFTVDPHDERVVYMGIGPIRLFRSEDGGKKFEPLDGMLDFGPEVTKKWGVPAQLKGIEFPHVRHIFIHPDDQNLIYVLLEHGGVLLSRDRGKTWYDRSVGIDYVDMHYIENFPGSKERYYVSSARGFFRTRQRRRTLAARRDRHAVGVHRSCTAIPMSGISCPADGWSSAAAKVRRAYGVATGTRRWVIFS